MPHRQIIAFILALIFVLCCMSGCYHAPEMVKRRPIPIPTAQRGSPPIQKTPIYVHKVYPVERISDLQRLQLIPSKTAFTTDEPVVVTINNVLAVDIYARAATQCSVVALERHDSDRWREVEACRDGRNDILVPAGATQRIVLAPAASQLERTMWQAGLYRVTIIYALQPGQPDTAVQHTVSTIFGIGRTM